MAALGIEELMELKVTSVYGASGYLQKINEAPSRVTILTSRDIQHYGWRTLAELLNSVPGFYTTYDRNYHYAGVRGFGRPSDYNSRVLLLVDGHRLNENIYFMAPIGTDFPIDLDLIDRVEVIQGPSSSLYGAGAFFGVINVFTRKGLDVKNVEVSGAAGSFETYKGRMSYGYNNKPKQADLLLSGSYMESQGQRNLYFKEFDDPATNNGRVPEPGPGPFPESFYQGLLEGTDPVGGLPVPLEVDSHGLLRNGLQRPEYQYRRRTGLSGPAL